MKYKLKVYGIWEFGQRKDSQGNPHQEDSMFPEFGKQSDSDRLFILCDGMGGHDAGEVASATVCEAMSQSILNDGHDTEGLFTPEDLSNALDAAFDALDTKDSGAEKKMGTTMTFLKLHSQGATIAHMGDSRVYQIRPGKTGADTRIIFQTEDHSLVNDLIKIGELTKEEARFSKQKNVITRAMQPNMGRRPKADIYNTADIKPGDYFYLCSDGMLEQPEMESGESLLNIFSSQGGTDENKVEILKSVTEKNRDNHTAFIIHILDVLDPIVSAVDNQTSSEENNDKFVAIVENEDLSRSNKGIMTSVIRFVVAAVVVAAAIIGFNYFKSCSIDKSGETIGLPSEKPSSPGGVHGKPSETNSTVKPNTPADNPSDQVASDVVNPNTISQSASPAQSTGSQHTEAGSIHLPSKRDQSEDVVDSDQQIIQNNLKK